MDLNQWVGASFLLSVIVGLVAIALVIYALVDLFREPMDNGMRLIWVLVILFFPIIGSIVYLIAGSAARRRAV